jgi:hypothetical protein
MLGFDDLEHRRAAAVDKSCTGGIVRQDHYSRFEIADSRFCFAHVTSNSTMTIGEVDVSCNHPIIV